MIRHRPGGLRGEFATRAPLPGDRTRAPVIEQDRARRDVLDVAVPLNTARYPMKRSATRAISDGPVSGATKVSLGTDGSGPSMDLFKCVGFFNEKRVIEAHLRDFFVSAKRHNIQATIMFGTLLGHLRHGDIIPWDDDVDIVVFNYDTFLLTAVPELEAAGYIVEPDIRDGHRMGCRIFHRTSELISNRGNLRFPWLGIWEHESVGDDVAVLRPEETRYRMHDFLPLRWEDFLGTSVGVPNDPHAILNTYFETADWMTHCVLPERDHRNGGVFTHFPQDKFLLSRVLEYLARAPGYTRTPRRS